MKYSFVGAAAALDFVTDSYVIANEKWSDLTNFTASF